MRKLKIKGSGPIPSPNPKDINMIGDEEVKAALNPVYKDNPQYLKYQKQTTEQEIAKNEIRQKEWNKFKELVALVQKQIEEGLDKAGFKKTSVKIKINNLADPLPNNRMNKNYTITISVKGIEGAKHKEAESLVYSIADKQWPKQGVGERSCYFTIKLT